MVSLIRRTSWVNIDTNSYDKRHKKKGTYQLTSLKIKIIKLMFDNKYLVLHIQLSKTITNLGKIQDGSLEI
jgi:hypothetical protein